MEPDTQLCVVWEGVRQSTLLGGLQNVAAATGNKFEHRGGDLFREICSSIILGWDRGGELLEIKLLGVG